jgi:hypothetical protein
MKAGDEVAFYQVSKGQRVAITFKNGERVAAEFVAHTEGRRGGISYVSFRPLTGNRTLRKVFASSIDVFQAL